MTIEFQCTECGRPMRAPESAAGKRGKCAQCGSIVPIPELTEPTAQPQLAQPTPDGKIEFLCPSCSRPVRTPASAAGKRGRCPHCSEIMPIPAVAAAAAEPARPTPSRPPAATAKPTGSAGRVIEFRCPQCQSTVRAPASLAGKVGQCPKCQTKLTIPGGTPRGATPNRPTGPGAAPATAAPGPFDPLGGLTPLDDSLTPLDSSGLAPLDGGLTPLGGGQAADPFGAAADPFGSGSSPFSAPPSDDLFGSVPAASAPGAPAAGYFADPGTLGGPASAAGSASTNPYAAPAWSPATTGVSRGAGGSRAVAFDELFGKTWKVFSPNLGMSMLLGLTVFGLNFAFSLFSNVLQAVAQMIGDPIIGMGIIGIVLVLNIFYQTFVTLGQQLACLRWAKSGHLSINDFFQVGPYYGRGLGVVMIMVVSIGGVMLVCLLPGFVLGMARLPEAGVIALIVGLCVGVPTAFVLGLKSFLATFYVLDRNLGPIAALQASFRTMTLGNCAVLFASTFCASILATLATLLTCCIGGLAAGPFLILMGAMMYVLASSSGK